MVAGERAEGGEEGAADHVRDAQRHHGLRQQGGDKEDGADQGKHVGQRDVGQTKISSRRLNMAS